MPKTVEVVKRAEQTSEELQKNPESFVKFVSMKIEYSKQESSMQQNFIFSQILASNICSTRNVYSSLLSICWFRKERKKN